jgi:hypothetical protein
MSSSATVRSMFDGLTAPEPTAGLADQRAAELLAGLPAAHRRAVASALGLRAAASAEVIGVAICDPERIAAVVGSLSSDACTLAAKAALFDDATVYESWSGRPSPGAAELERYGLAFAFRQSYSLTQYYVPADVRAALALALAAPLARGLAGARPARLIETPLQLAHDSAALWAELARSPVRLKTDGMLYQREVPRMLAALPPLELHGPDDALASMRLEFVLLILRDELLVQVRVDDRPGAEVRRELVGTGNPRALLGGAPAELRARLLRHGERTRLWGATLALTASLEQGATVGLKSFGVALRKLGALAGLTIDPRVSDLSVALGGLHFAWLAGEVVIGIDREGTPSAVRLAPAPVPPPGRRALVCQANFELVALAPPTPAERLVLALTCEPVAGQAHVFRLTRESARGAQRSGALPRGVVRELEELVGELPQNVVASLLDWTSSVRPPLRLRTAMVLDTGDESTAEALIAGQLAGHVVERLGPTQLAIRAGDLPAVQAALKKAGHALDPGIDRVSGRWSERESGPTEAEASWTPYVGSSAPAGKQISTLGAGTPKPARKPAPAPRQAHSLLDPDDDDRVQVLLDAIERDGDVFIVYAGARGTTRRQITPYEVEGAAVHAYCHLRDDDRSFWLASILEAEPVLD